MKPAQPPVPPHLARKLAILAHTNPQLHEQITGGKENMKLKCTWSGCRQQWAVSDEDPDSTLDDAMHHVTRRHSIGASIAHNWLEEA